MTKVFSLLLLALTALPLDACGRQDKQSASTPVDSSKRVGHYALGDKVKHKITRVGYSPSEYLRESEVVNLNGDTVQIKTTDTEPTSFGLVKWQDSPNPEFSLVSYNLQDDSLEKARECKYQDEEAIKVETAAGTFDCVHYAYQCKSATETYRIDGCNSASIAVKTTVQWKKEILGEGGAVVKSVQWTLLENKKN